MMGDGRQGETTPRRLKVLMSAYACEPGKGSEPGVGWNMAREMARRHEVWVLTRANNRPVIEAELAQHPVPGLHFIWHDLPRWARWWKRGGRGVQLYYYLWQLSAVHVARQAHADVRFDIAHHVTFVKYWAPTCLAFVSVPYVWGPVGGGESAPLSFWPGCGLRGIIYEIVRSLTRRLAEFDPLVRHSARRAAVALATTEETAVRLYKLKSHTVVVCSEAGLSEAELRVLRPVAHIRPGTTVRFLSVGRLLHWKGYHLSLEAFARSGLSDAEYCLVGDGPERQRLEKLCWHFGIEKKVRFLGTIPRNDVLAQLAESDIFIHPSLHDSGGWACLEAMAAGVPVICLDIGGPREQVTNETGLKIIGKNPHSTLNALAAAMKYLAGDSELRRSMGMQAALHVNNLFNWERHCQKLIHHYQSVAQKNHDQLDRK